ncbi:hypothetical protein Tsp_01743 [Trichinella spiralis]|uniref:hypothetical protein n=1 Tax=Trichinella spiralis TaxID=6334 RepID=UPI0001EFCA80|nr:hypothetical protein Tsp_01743 [Trichinella spiralis]
MSSSSNSSGGGGGGGSTYKIDTQNGVVKKKYPISVRTFDEIIRTTKWPIVCFKTLDWELNFQKSNTNQCMHIVAHMCAVSEKIQFCSAYGLSRLRKECVTLLFVMLDACCSHRTFQSSQYSFCDLLVTIILMGAVFLFELKSSMHQECTFSGLLIEIAIYK